MTTDFAERDVHPDDRAEGFTEKQVNSSNEGERSAKWKQ
jgi:hypothetical protein